jgi:hypothetical protein
VSAAKPSVVGLIVQTAEDGSTVTLGDRTALDWTRHQLEQVSGLRNIVLASVPDTHTVKIQRDRAWSPTAWRGGIGGATVYDELIEAAPLAGVAQLAEVDAMLIVGAGWPLVNPKLCGDVIERYASQPEHKMVFTQAAPGFCGILIARELLLEMAEHNVSVGQMLGYQPAAPQADPIGRDVCVAVPPAVRDAPVRATADSARWIDLIERVIEAGEEGDAAAAATRMTAALTQRGHVWPTMLTMELTPRRQVRGPVVPISQIEVDRPDMDGDTFEQVTTALAEPGDVALMLGGLGDPLEHPNWSTMRQVLEDCPVRAVGVETDLLCDRDLLPTLDGLVVKVRLNADTAEMYQQLMGLDALDRVLENMRWLLENQPATRVVPAFVKCRANVHEMESFYDRWLRVCGSAVVEGPTTGAGLIDDIGVIDMAPPKRVACRQLLGRMTVLGDGTVPRCDQDWLGRDAVGHVADEALDVLWARLQEVRRAHQAGEYGGGCEGCRAWFKP